MLPTELVVASTFSKNSVLQIGTYVCFWMELSGTHVRERGLRLDISGLQELEMDIAVQSELKADCSAQKELASYISAQREALVNISALQGLAADIPTQK